MMLEKAHLKNEEEEQMHQKQLLKLYLNLATCYNKQGKPKYCISWCKRALEICNTDTEARVKALYHYGKVG
jgi:hypothetical protein